MNYASHTIFRNLQYHYITFIYDILRHLKLF
uniref:Uncharacterized protein n=1 Tax=Myoviridae sp. ctfyA6 TaxID=2827698 RepID=A0A8S5SSX4_9CAUD|nr:MAG TPA: hypothetical protein [Myoviridae sp. ctfyA6]